MKNTTLILIGLVILTIAVRLIVALNTPVISSDGPFYINVAKDFARGDYQSALQKQTFHPLYPFLISLFPRPLQGKTGWEWAGIGVSILFSGLAIIPLYFIVRRFLSQSKALIAGLFYAFHPYAAQVSSSVLTTGIFMGLFIFALWVTIKAIESACASYGADRSGKHKCLYYSLLSGFLSFLIYLTRPDGIVFLLLSIIAVIISPRNNPVQNSIIKRKILSILMMLIPWILLMTPYLMIVHSVKGKIGLSGKANVKEMVGWSSENRLTDDSEEHPQQDAIPQHKIPVRKYLYGLYLLVVDFIKSANPILFLLLVLGIIRSAGYPNTHSLPVPNSFGVKAGSGATAPSLQDSDKLKQSRWLSGFIWLVFAVFVFVLFRYAVIYERMSKRYTITLFIILMGWVVNGMDFITDIIYPTLKKLKDSLNRDYIFYIGTFLIIVFLSFYTFKPSGESKLIEKNTGELIRISYSKNGYQPGATNGPLIITMRSRIAYYAEGEMIAPPDGNGNFDKLFGFISDQGIDYLVLDGRMKAKYPLLEGLMEDTDRLAVSMANLNIRMEEVLPAFSGIKGGFYRVYRIRKK